MAARRKRGPNAPTFLTTHQVATLLGVSIASVVNWTRQGRLQAQRTPGGHRRIALTELIRFAGEHDYPLPPEIRAASVRETALPTVLVLHGQRDFAELVSEFLALEGGVRVLLASDPLRAGFLLGRGSVSVVLIQLEDGEIDPGALADLPWGEGARPVLLGSTTLRSHETERMVSEGILDDVVEQTADIHEYVRRIRRHLPR